MQIVVFLLIHKAYGLFPFIFSFPCSALRNGFAFDKLTNPFPQPYLIRHNIKLSDVSQEPQIPTRRGKQNVAKHYPCLYVLLPTAGSHKLHKNKKPPTKSDNLITNFYVNHPTEHAKEKALALVGTTALTINL